MSRLQGQGVQESILTDAATVSDYTAYHTPETVRREFVPEAIDRRPLLDKPSEPNPMLSAAMHEALTAIMLTSDGAVMPLKVRITGSHTQRSPTSDLKVTLEELDERFHRCKTHRARLLVIKDAQQEAARRRYSPKSEIIARGTQDWRRAIATDPRPRRVVAQDYRVSSRTITACRKEFAAK